MNAIVGLVIPNDVNPAVLADAGFRLAGLEVPVLSRTGRSVTVDVVLFNDAASHLMLCEVKSGANLDEDQAERYAAIDPVGAVQAARVTITRRTAPTVEVLYVCLEEHCDRVLQGLGAAGVEFPVLCVGAAAITLVAEQHASKGLRAALATGPVALNAPPPHLVPFDHDSPVEVIERFVKAQLVAELSQRRPSVTIPSLVERVVPHAAVFARRARSTLIRKVGDACRMIAECDRATFSYQPPINNEPAVMHLLRTPETNDPRGRTQAYQALARRPGTSRRATVVDPLQPDLFAELEVGEDVGGADETQGGRGES